MAQVDSLKMVIEVDAQQAISKLNQYNAAQNKTTSETTKLKTATEDTHNKLVAFRGVGEGLNLGFIKLAGTMGFVAMGVVNMARMAKDAEAAFAKLHPELINVEGSALSWGKSNDRLKESIGGLISAGLTPLRAALQRDVIEPLTEVIKQMAGMEDGWTSLAEIMGKGASQVNVPANLKVIQNQIDSLWELMESIKSSYKNDFAIPQDVVDQLARYQTKFDQLVEARTLLRELQKNPTYEAFPASSKGSPPAEDRAIYSPINFASPIATGDSVTMFEAMAEAARGLGANAQGAAYSLDDMWKSMKEMLAQETISGLWAIGEALGSGGNGADAFKSMLQSMMRSLPQMLLMAGLNALAFPGGAYIPLGIALLAASGLSALLGGAISGAMGTTASSSYAGAGAGAGAGAQNVTYVNVYGNVWGEQDLAVAIASRQGQW